jgi:acyl-CoA thioesterase II
MDSRSFLGLRQSHNRFRWSMEVTPGLSTGGGFLFGGCGLGAAISAMEATTDRSCIWATAQYLAYAKPGQILDIDVTLAVEGHQMTQARAVGHVGNREILTVNAALGTRPFPHEGSWQSKPVVPGPEECGPRVWRAPPDGTINERLELRTAIGRDWDQLDGTHGDGHTAMWACIPEMIDGVDATALAILGDYVPSGVGQALGIHGGGNSLDNTLRVIRLVPTEWVLIDIHIQGVANGFGHGLVHLFAEDGTLMATASQSCIARIHKPIPTPNDLPAPEEESPA